MILKNQLFVILQFKVFGWYNNFKVIFSSFSRDYIFLYLFTNFNSPTLASIRARCLPMHPLGPPPNPLKAKAGRSSH